MKTGFDAIDVVMGFLNVEELKNLISGSVTMGNQRPFESRTEDITVGCLQAPEGVTQDILINVNIYAPNIKVPKQDAFVEMPDMGRLNIITSKVVELLKGNTGQYWNNGNLFITNMFGPLQEEKTNQHYMNIRVNVKYRANNN